jgi:hypothetical protein
VGEELVVRLLAAEVFLGEGRAVVGAVDLLANHEQLALRVTVSDRLCRGDAREAAANEKIFDVGVAHRVLRVS